MSMNKTIKCSSDDTIYCFFYLPFNNGDNLEEICASVNKTVQHLSANYIWHKDEFTVLVPLRKENSDLPPHLISTTCFGDNIEDEWFIVYLLFEISKQHTDIIIQTYDNDGDFFLIEAANFLPSWTNPDTTENRVYIYQNHIHLISPTAIDLGTEVKVNNALNLITDSSKITKSTEIQQAVFKRIDMYPEKLNDNIHRAIVKLPAHIATLLNLKPTLISSIVSAYCDHDVFDAKICRNVKYDDCVTSQIKFTKCLYAMLIHSKIIKNIKHIRVNENDKASSLGLKLTCGYEMIIGKSSEDLFNSKEFNKFLKSLTDNGYFKDNIEGSQNYKQLLENSKKFFLGMECPINTQVGNDIKQQMQTREFLELKETIRNTSHENVEDNDDWLNIHPEQLNDFLNSRYGKQTKFKNGDLINSKTITTELSHFLKQSSDFEGIETVRDDEVSDDNNIQFDTEEFMSCVTKMMKLMTSNDEEMLSDLSDDNLDDTDISVGDDDLDTELNTKLCSDGNSSQTNSDILFNIIQSIKEEGPTGPSSNILRTIGVRKTDILDSDDDDE